MAFLECKDLVCGYDKKPVTCPLNFEVNEGDYLSIIGENGIGKSTLVKTLLRLIPALSGSIVYGEGIKYNEVGYLPQQSLAQRDFPATVYEIVLSGTLSRRKNKLFYNTEDKNIAFKNIERMGITNLINKSYRNLSGGQQQRVLLARALCSTTKLIILDEPVTGLDPKAALEFYELLNSLNDNEGLTIIMVSHDMGSTVKNAKSILHIGSKQLFYGRTKDYINTDYYRAFDIINNK